MTPEEKAKAYDEALERTRGLLEGMEEGGYFATLEDVKEIFPELAEPEDERIRKEIISHLQHEYVVKRYVSDVEYDRWIAWLEKQDKSKWTDEDEESMQHCCGAVAAADYYTLEDKEEMANWLVSLKQRIHVSSAKTCKNDTLYDLLHKMPSYITVDGIFYHFMLRKTAISYMAFYDGEGEGSGKVIFCTAGEPIELLTAMLEKLKKEGLLE